MLALKNSNVPCMAVFMLFDMFSYVTTLMSFIPGKWNPFCTENPYLISFDIKIDTTALNASVKYFFLYV